MPPTGLGAGRLLTFLLKSKNYSLRVSLESHPIFFGSTPDVNATAPYHSFSPCKRQDHPLSIRPSELLPTSFYTPSSANRQHLFHPTVPFFGLHPIFSIRTFPFLFSLSDKGKIFPPQITPDDIVFSLLHPYSALLDGHHPLPTFLFRPLSFAFFPPEKQDIHRRLRAVLLFKLLCPSLSCRPGFPRLLGSLSAAISLPPFGENNLSRFIVSERR